MTPGLKGGAASATRDAIDADDTVRRALSNRQTAVTLYAAAALRWLDQDQPDAPAARDSVRAMLDELAQLNALMKQVESTLNTVVPLHSMRQA